MDIYWGNSWSICFHFVAEFISENVKIYLKYIPVEERHLTINTMATDVLLMQGTMASAAMVLV